MTLKLNCYVCREKIHNESDEWRYIFDGDGPRSPKSEINCCSEQCYEEIMTAECTGCGQGIKERRLNPTDDGDWICPGCEYPEYQPGS